MAQDSNPDGGKIFQTDSKPPVQWVLALFPRGKAAGCSNDPHLLLVPRLEMGRAIPLLPLSACFARYRTAAFISVYASGHKFSCQAATDYPVMCNHRSGLMMAN
jgi:hypothetical protein